MALRLLKRLNAEVRWNSKKFSHIREHVRGSRTTVYDLIPRKNIERFGKEFLTSFPKKVHKGRKRTRFVTDIAKTEYESPVSVALHTESTGAGNPQTDKIGEVKLAFTRDEVAVEAIQGVPKRKPQLDRFKSMHGKTWAIHLMEEVENHARSMGFKTVKIRKPETMHYFRNHGEEAMYIEDEHIQDDMRRLYHKVAEKLGYKPNGCYFYKKL